MFCAICSLDSNLGPIGGRVRPESVLFVFLFVLSVLSALFVFALLFACSVWFSSCGFGSCFFGLRGLRCCAPVAQCVVPRRVCIVSGIVLGALNPCRSVVCHGQVVGVNFVRR